MSEDPYAHLTEAGERGWGEVMATDGPAPVSEAGSFMDITNKIVFGDLWHRPGLSRHDRRLVTLSVLADAGRMDIAPMHVGAALRSGDLSPEELEEMVVHLAFYAGWPRAAAFYLVVAREIAEWRAAQEGDGAG